MSEKESEAQRRKRVAEEKLWGSLIESIERSRKNPIAKSLVFRMVYLSGAIEQFSNVIKIKPINIDPTQTVVPTFTCSQANFLIKTYNDIISDIHSNFKRRDATVNDFSDFEELETPTFDDVSKTLYMMGISLYQAISYLIRWM